MEHPRDRRARRYEPAGGTALPREALRSFDAELAATIERLQRVRVELGLILRRSAPTDLPPEFAPVDADAEMSDADRSLVVVMTRVLGPAGMQTYADMLQNLPHDPVSADFDDLDPDADAATRQDIAERMARYTRALQAEHPGLMTVNADAPGGARFAQQTLGKAMLDLYSPAQIDVLARLAPLLAEAPDTS